MSGPTPGNDREAGDVKALACCALDGWVVSESIVTCAAIFEAVNQLKPDE